MNAQMDIPGSMEHSSRNCFAMKVWKKFGLVDWLPITA